MVFESFCLENRGGGGCDRLKISTCMYDITPTFCKEFFAIKPLMCIFKIIKIHSQVAKIYEGIF